MNIFEIFNNKPSVRTNPTKYSPIVETIGPDRNDPYEQGWRARPGYDFNPYAKDTAEYQKWEDGQAERQAQPNHYDEGVAEGSEKAHGWKIGKMYRGEKEPFEVAYVDASDEKTALAKAHHTLKPNHMQILTVMRRPQGVAEGSEEDSYSDKFVQSQIDYYNKHGLSGNSGDRARINGSLNYYQHIKNKRIKGGSWSLEQGVAEACWKGYHKEGNKELFGKRVPNCVKNEGEERNELDTPAVQAALKKMAARHRDEKWSTEQLAALGRRLAAQDKKSVSGTNQTEDQWHGEDNAWSDSKGQWSDGRGQWSESIDRDVAEYLSEMKSAGYDIK